MRRPQWKSQYLPCWSRESPDNPIFYDFNGTKRALALAIDCCFPEGLLSKLLLDMQYLHHPDIR